MLAAPLQPASQPTRTASDGVGDGGNSDRGLASETVSETVSETSARSTHFLEPHNDDGFQNVSFECNRRVPSANPLPLPFMSARKPEPHSAQCSDKSLPSTARHWIRRADVDTPVFHFKSLCSQQGCRPKNVAGNGDNTLQEILRSDTE